ncbi:MAG: alpha/beta fold hydrolase [Sedimentisphaerales bacterium]
MDKYKILILVLICCILQAATAISSAQIPPNVGRERARDGIIHIEKELILDVPEVERLCDEMEIDKRRVNVGDCELYCEIEGDGMPVVLLHGGPGATHHYFHPSFSRAKDFVKVIYYDQRGCGLSDYKKGEGYSIEQAVEDLENLRRAMNIRRWVVLGHSYGGLLAQCYIVKYPESVSGLILVGSKVAMPMIFSTRQYEFISKEERARMRVINSNKTLTTEQIIYDKWLNGDWKRQCYYKPSRERIAQKARYEWKQDSNFNSIMSRDAAKVNLQGAFESCPIPTLILEGRWDLTWDKDKPGILHKNHPNARLIFFEESAHSPFDNEPEKFFDTLRDYILNLPEIARGDSEEWKGKLSKWKEEREKEKGPSFPTDAMSEGEAEAIEEFRKIKKRILVGESYEDLSTPLRTFLTFLSAHHFRDVEAYKRISALDLDKKGQKPTSESMAEIEEYFIKFDILRAPLPPDNPEEGTFWPIYVTNPNETELADTVVPVFWKRNWMWIGNMGSSDDWCDFQSFGKSLLEKYGK